MSNPLPATADPAIAPPHVDRAPSALASLRSWFDTTSNPEAGDSGDRRAAPGSGAIRVIPTTFSSGCIGSPMWRSQWERHPRGTPSPARC
jgi:hypothetical protein